MKILYQFLLGVIFLFAKNTFALIGNVSKLTTGSLSLVCKPNLGSNKMTLGMGITMIYVGSPIHYFQTNGSGTVKGSFDNNTNWLFPVGIEAYNLIRINIKTGIVNNPLKRIKR
jgi:hypothetical protein